MTRIKKFLVTGLLVLVSCCTFLGSAISNFAQSIFSFGTASAGTFNGGNTNENGSSIAKGDILTVTGIQSSGKRGDTINLPYVNSGVTATNSEGTDTTANNKYFVEVISPYGENLTSYDASNDTMSATEGGDVEFNSAENTLRLTPSVTGTYQIRYHVKNATGIWTSSRTYNLNITADSYNISLMSNDSIVMPSTIRIDDSNSTESWAKSTVRVALPLLYNEEGKLIEEDIIFGDVVTEGETSYYYVIKYDTLANTTLGAVSSISSNVNNYESYKTYTIRKVDATSEEITNINYVLKINISSAGTEKLVVGGTITDQAVPYENVAFTFDAAAGKNVIDYRLYYKNQESRVLSYLTFTINGSKSYDSENIELSASPSSTIRSSNTSYKQKVYLPSVSAINKNENNNSISAFYYYIVRAVDNEGNYYPDQSKYVTMGRDESGFYFIPIGPSNTRYEIYYNVSDFYGNTVEEDDNYDYEITVTDRKLAEYYYTNSYDPDNADSANLDDLTYKIPNKIYVNPEATGEEIPTITIPALWASDESGISYATRSIASDSRTFINKNDESISGTIRITDNEGITDTSFDGEMSEGFSILDYVTFDDLDGTKYYIDSKGDYRRMEGDTQNTETDPILEGTDLRDVKNSRTATLKLDPTIFGAGVYTVTLSVRDNANNSNISNRTFTFEIVNEKLTNSRPTVTFGNTTIGNVTSEQKISIPVPTISDSNDTRMLIKYYVEIGDRYIEVNTDEDGKNIVFNMNDPVATTVGGELDSTIYKLVTTSSSRSFNVVAVAYNDFADYDVIDFENYNEENERYDGIGLGRYSISIKYEEDKVAPKFDITSIGNINIGAFDQYSWVEVQGVTFYDNTDTARIYATVTDTKGNVYDYEDQNGAMTVTYTGSEYKYEFGGIRFKANNADVGNFYTVTYTLVDDGNNVVSYSFVLVQATDKTPPVISGIDGTEMTLELGRTLYFTGLTATDNGSSLDDGTITFDISVRNSEGRYFSQICRYVNGQLVFSPEEEGVYTISIIAKDAENNTSDERTIQVTVEDTIKPVISLIDSNTDQIIINENEITEDAENNTVYPSVSIPRFIVEDVGPTDANPNVSYSATGSITITTPKRDSNNANEYTYDMDGTLITEGVDNVLNFTASGNAFTFTPTARGEYTITYNGTDNSGNEAEEITIIVNVGDTENPEIILTNSFNTLLNNGFTLGENDTLVINPNARIYDDAGYNSEDIYVRDNAGFEYEVDDNNDDIEENDIHYVPVTITITDPSGDAVTRDDSDDSLYHYTFTEQGTYTISFTVTDEVGNRETYSRTFVVRAKPSSTIDTTTILGTVLIVVSAVILAGVIVYFVKGTKQLPKKSKESNKKNNNKNEIDK